jgi:N-acetylglutamate synthase-like GNAT family acetyltransferase
LVRWKRFTWELAKLPTQEAPLPGHYTLRAASEEDEEAVHRVIMGAFSLDSSWSDAFKSFEAKLESQLTKAFANEDIPALVISHGQRIIAASALTVDREAESNLISGPCVLMEYRNRGLGSALLYYSLKQLQNAGLERAHGLSKDNVVAGKFIYPKFGSVSSPHEPETALAGK